MVPPPPVVLAVALLAPAAALGTLPVRVWAAEGPVHFTRYIGQEVYDCSAVVTLQFVEGGGHFALAKQVVSTSPPAIDNCFLLTGWSFVYSDLMPPPPPCPVDIPWPAQLAENGDTITVAYHEVACTGDVEDELVTMRLGIGVIEFADDWHGMVGPEAAVMEGKLVRAP